MKYRLKEAGPDDEIFGGGSQLSPGPGPELRQEPLDRALCLGLAYLTFLPQAYAGNYMSATMLVTMGQSKDMSRRALVFI